MIHSILASALLRSSIGVTKRRTRPTSCTSRTELCQTNTLTNESLAWESGSTLPWHTWGSMQAVCKLEPQYPPLLSPASYSAIQNFSPRNSEKVRTKISGTERERPVHSIPTPQKQPSLWALSRARTTPVRKRPQTLPQNTIDGENNS